MYRLRLLAWSALAGEWRLDALSCQIPMSREGYAEGVTTRPVFTNERLDGRVLPKPHLQEPRAFVAREPVSESCWCLVPLHSRWLNDRSICLVVRLRTFHLVSHFAVLFFFFVFIRFTVVFRWLNSAKSGVV